MREIRSDTVQIEPRPRKYLVHRDRLQLCVEDLGDAGDVELESGRERKAVRKGKPAKLAVWVVGVVRTALEEVFVVAEHLLPRRQRG